MLKERKQFTKRLATMAQAIFFLSAGLRERLSNLRRKEYWVVPESTRAKRLGRNRSMHISPKQLRWLAHVVPTPWRRRTLPHAPFQSVRSFQRATCGRDPHPSHSLPHIAPISRRARHSAPGRQAPSPPRALRHRQTGCSAALFRPRSRRNVGALSSNKGSSAKSRHKLKTNRRRGRQPQVFAQLSRIRTCQ